MDVADGNRHRVHTRFAGKLGRLIRVGSCRLFAARIANEANLALAGNGSGVGHFGDCRGFRDVLG